MVRVGLFQAREGSFMVEAHPDREHISHGDSLLSEPRVGLLGYIRVRVGWLVFQG